MQEGLMVFSDDFLHFPEIKKIFVEFTNFNYPVALKLGNRSQELFPPYMYVHYKITNLSLEHCYMHQKRIAPQSDQDDIVACTRGEGGGGGTHPKFW